MVNIATPKINNTGFNDPNDVVQTIDTPIPAHLPLLMIMASKGTSDVTTIASDLVTQEYGLDSFDSISPMYNHQSKMASTIIQNNSAVTIKRITLPNSSKAVIRLALELAPCEIPVYERDSDGVVVYTMVNGVMVPKAIGVTNGTKLVWHTGATLRDNAIRPFGSATVIEDYRYGTEFSTTEGNLSTFYPLDGTDRIYGRTTLYPIIDIEVKDIGDYGNGIGITIDKLISGITYDSDVTLVETIKSMLYKLRVVEKNTNGYRVIPNSGNDNYTTISFISTDINPRNNNTLFIGDVIDTYIKKEDGTSTRNKPLGRVHVYSDNLNTVLNKLYNGYTYEGVNFRGESSVSASYNVTTTPQLIDLFKGLDVNNNPYTNILLTTGFNGVTFNDGLPIYASGGSDGLIYNADGTHDELEILAAYDREVRNFIGSVLADNTNLADRARFPISMVWDSGFSLDTKRALIRLMGFRSDVVIVLSTFIQADFVITSTPPVDVRPIITCSGAQQDVLLILDPLTRYTLEIDSKDLGENLTLQELLTTLEENGISVTLFNATMAIT